MTTLELILLVYVAITILSALLIFGYSVFVSSRGASKVSLWEILFVFIISIFAPITFFIMYTADLKDNIKTRKAGKEDSTEN